MEDKKRVVLQPEYMKNFKCIGPSCEDNCCIGWRVALDKKTYLKYKKLQDKDLTPILNKVIKRKHNQKSENEYGSIKMEADAICPLLDKQKLCSVHRKLGESYLSNTCAIYPKFANEVNGKTERSATISCPEVARLSLLNPKGMDFEYIEEDADIRIIKHINLETEEHRHSIGIQKYFWDIRMFSIWLLQNRKYNLSERLINLGLVYKKIGELSESKNEKNIPELLENMKVLIDSEGFKSSIEAIPTNIEMQIEITKVMTEFKMSRGVDNERYLQCLKEMLLGLGYVEGDNEEIVIEKYEENYKLYFSPYFKDKEYILENFLVNEYFRQLMPFGVYDSIWNSYISLCLLYSIAKLHLIGMSGYHKGLTDELTLKLIQSFSKVVIHDNCYMNAIIKHLKEVECNSLAYLSILVKN